MKGKGERKGEGMEEEVGKWEGGMGKRDKVPYWHFFFPIPALSSGEISGGNVQGMSGPATACHLASVPIIAGFTAVLRLAAATAQFRLHLFTNCVAASCRNAQKIARINGSTDASAPSRGPKLFGSATVL